MSSQLKPPPEARLIQQRRDAADPPMSRRQAAATAGISVSQWSDVERGSKRAGQGTVIPVKATAQTLARMAQVVGATTDDLTAVGRTDAASQLQNFERDQGIQQRLSSVPGLGPVIRQVTDTHATELLPIIASALDAIDNSTLPPAARRELTSLFTSNLINDATRRYTELQLILRLAEAQTSPR